MNEVLRAFGSVNTSRQTGPRSSLRQLSSLSVTRTAAVMVLSRVGTCCHRQFLGIGQESAVPTEQFSLGHRFKDRDSAWDRLEQAGLSARHRLNTCLIHQDIHNTSASKDHFE